MAASSVSLPLKKFFGSAAISFSLSYTFSNQIVSIAPVRLDYFSYFIFSSGR
jgi:hypothetical protein